MRNVLVLCLVLLVLVACGGGGGGSTPVTYTIGGTVTGYAGATIDLVYNTDAITVDVVSGNITIASNVPSGSSYDVTIPSPPVGYTCAVVNGSSPQVTADVTNVDVICSLNSYSISGTVTGYAGGSIDLVYNTTSINVAVVSGLIAIDSSVPHGFPYEVTIVNSPSGFDCTVANGGPATATTDVTDIAVTCVPWSVTGTISGFAGTVNVVDDGTTIPVVSTVAPNTFTINSNAANGTTYAVTVPASPPGYACNVANGSGTVTTASVNDVVVHCVAVDWVWSPISSSLAEARRNHTATSLADDSILVTGGVQDGSPIKTSSELLALSNSRTTTASLHVARYSHTATLLGDGSVLVAGGNTGGAATNSSEIYSSTVWTLTTNLQSSGMTTMNVGRYNHSATLLDDGSGRVLVAGGFAGVSSLASFELFDPSTGVWSQTASALTEARDLHTATSLQDGAGTVLVVGGNSLSPVATAELYDASNNTWNSTGSLNAARYSHTATLLPNGKVLVVGGRAANGSAIASAELYDPATELWTAAGNLQSARFGHTATLRADGTVLIAGGSGTGPLADMQTELYDSLTGAWIDVRTTADQYLTEPRTGFTATLRSDGSVCVIGGSNNSTQLTSIYLYGPPTP